MRFRGLDLNLLTALDALLELRSVSQAATRLNLSQPAMSAALARLREYFRDDLLVISGRRMYPTAFAEGLVADLKDCLRGLEALVSRSAGFTPATSNRTFLIEASDYITVAAIVPLITELSTVAPGVRIELTLPSDDSPQRLAEGKIDLLLTPESFVHPDHPAELLFEERQVLTGWDQNAIFRSPPSQDEVLAASHISVAFGSRRTASYADRQLALMGIRRRIDVVASSFTTLPWLLMGGPRVAILHERLAKALAARFPITFVATPFEIPPMREMIQFHSSRQRDEALLWLRQRIIEAGAAINS